MHLLHNSSFRIKRFIEEQRTIKVEEEFVQY